ncbi:cytochrome P450 [Streptomyces cavernae]|uniref:cytochrome P450 n=1 Tax=Streptomyces cavernae TaxID=2259034 RepID=UPI000FEB6FBA|nr:cytochrome P450 [Streptomyces cavernae]
MTDTHIPGPAGLPLIGSLLELRRNPMTAFLRAQRDYGDVVRLTAGPPGLRQKLYLVFSAEGAQQVLGTQAANFRKDNVLYGEVRESIGNGLVTSQDDEYRRQRRLIQPLFTRRRVDGYAEAACTEAELLAERWQSASGGTVDLSSEMPSFSLHALSRILFGADADAAVEVMRRCWPTLLDYTLQRGYSLLRLPRHWPTPGNRRGAAAQRELYALCDRIIAERRTGRTKAGAAAWSAGGDEEGDDLLSVLIRARGEHGEALDGDELRDQVLIFLLAGHETTATSLAVTLHLLAGHPEVQARARAEVDQVLAGRRPGAADLDSLPYLTMVLKEAMRVHAPVMFVGRRAVADAVVDGYRIPAGADVLICPGVTHRKPEYWPDPERFDPERFSPEAEASRPRYAWYPFGGGPRACIGQHFSMLESVLCLAVLLQRYELAPVDTEVPLGTRLTLQEFGPIMCRVTSRAPVLSTANAAG